MNYYYCRSMCDPITKICIHPNYTPTCVESFNSNIENEPLAWPLHVRIRQRQKLYYKFYHCINSRVYRKEKEWDIGGA